MTRQIRLRQDHSSWFDPVLGAYEEQVGQIEQIRWVVRLDESNPTSSWNWYLSLLERSWQNLSLFPMLSRISNLITTKQLLVPIDIGRYSLSKWKLGVSFMPKKPLEGVSSVRGGSRNWRLGPTNKHFDSFLLSLVGCHQIVVKRTLRGKGHRRKLSRMFSAYLRHYRKLTVNRVAKFPFQSTVFAEPRVGGRSWDMTRRVSLARPRTLHSSARASRFQLSWIGGEFTIWTGAGSNVRRLPPISKSPIQFSGRENVAILGLGTRNFLTDTRVTAIWWQKWFSNDGIGTLVANSRNELNRRPLLSNLIPVNANWVMHRSFLASEVWRGRFFVSDTSMFSHFCSRFLEFLFNRRSCLAISSILWQKFSVEETIRCHLWIRKLRNFSKVLGKGFFLTDTVHISYRAFRMKDPHLLINWFANTFKKISFWKYRSLFHFLRYFCRFFLWPTFKELGVKGVRFKLKGKISVSGNARTRTISTSTGVNNFSSYSDRVLHAKRLIPSFTGVMGFQLWLMF